MSNENPLVNLKRVGQSIWLDFISRPLMNSGELQRLIEADGVSGMTSNPAIFQKAISESTDYDDDIRMRAQEEKPVEEIFFEIAVSDIQRAADMFRSTYDQTGGGDGFVSLEVSPALAHDTEQTVLEARRIWEALDRPNVFVKVPATKEGIPAIRQLIGEGINVNVTLLFGLPRYQAVANAYIQGLEECLARGHSVERLASVASFFLSRIDVLVDGLLDQQLPAGTDTAVIGSLRGQTAIASAKIAYQMYKEAFTGERFRRLAESGARPQRLLWASTSTKNPQYSDVKYVEPLIGPDTINTMPLETINAYRDHGEPMLTIEDRVREAHYVLERLPNAHIDLAAVAQQLENEGVEKFVKPFDALMESFEVKRRAALEQVVGAGLDR